MCVMVVTQMHQTRTRTHTHILKIYKGEESSVTLAVSLSNWVERIIFLGGE